MTQNLKKTDINYTNNPPICGSASHCPELALSDEPTTYPIVNLKYYLHSQGYDVFNSESASSTP